MRAERIPPATVARLPVYVQGLSTLAGEGLEVVSSQRLAAAIGIQAPQIRRDLSYLGAFGTPGVGYDVKALLQEVSGSLGLARQWPVAIVGCGHLGSALAAYSGFSEHNFQVVALFDPKPDLVGRRVGDLVILHPDCLPRVARELGIEIAVLATPTVAAQGAADKLVATGITSILNFTPTTLTVPPGVAVRNIDLAVEMQILSFHETFKQVAEIRGQGAPASRRSMGRWPKERVPCD